MNEDFLMGKVATVRPDGLIVVALTDMPAGSEVSFLPSGDDPYTMDFDRTTWRYEAMLGFGVTRPSAHTVLTGVTDGGGARKAPPRQWACWSVGRNG